VTLHYTYSERPGDTSQPTSFLSCFEAENKTAAYLGLNHTSALRTLAASYPAIDAFVAFDPISNNARVQNSLALLADGTEPFTNVSDADAVKKWPVDANDRDMAHKRACRIAVILVNLKQRRARGLSS
jgi:hypothetical protein